MAKIDVIGQIELEHMIIRIESWKQEYGNVLTKEQNRILWDAILMLQLVARMLETNEPTTLPEAKK